MEPIIYKENDFPVELSRRQAYIAYKISWNDGHQKFTVREQRSSGWQTYNTTSGTYATFAEAYAAMETTARDMARHRDDVCILAREDNMRNLIGSWGMSQAQTDELRAALPEYGQIHKQVGLESFWSEVRSNFMETKADLWPDEGPKLAQIAIDAWKTPVDTEEGKVVALVVLSERGDIFIDYRDSIARTDPLAQEHIRDAKATLLEYYKEYSREACELPDELVVRLAHYAGEMEATKQISPPEWDALCSAIQDTIAEYYANPSQTNPFVIEDIAEKIFLDRFPAEVKKIAPEQNQGHVIQMPDGSTLRSRLSSGMVGADEYDPRTWQSIDIIHCSPEGEYLDVLASVDYEDDLGVRSLVYDRGKADPVYRREHNIGPDHSTSLSSIINSAESRNINRTQRSRERGMIYEQDPSDPGR